MCAHLDTLCMECKSTTYLTGGGGGGVWGYTSSNLLTEGQWHHIFKLISLDMSNTSYRHVYIDDVDKTSSFNWDVYSNTILNYSPSGTPI